MKNKLKTKYGDAVINKDGYYQISGGKFHRKLLHRLIYEESNGKISEGYIIHHKDFNKTNNDISNLECLTKSEHLKIHSNGKNNNMYGKKHTEKAKAKMKKNHYLKNGGKHPKGMLGKKMPKEAVEVVAEKNRKHYFRITHAGFNSTTGKPQYGIRGPHCKLLKTSVYLHKLYKWFSKEYPDEYLYLEVK